MLLRTVVLLHVVLGPAEQIQQTDLAKSVESVFTHRHGLEVIAGDASLSSRASTCEIDLSCVVELLRSTRAARALRINVNMELGLASVQWIDLNLGTLIDGGVVDITPEVPVVEAIVRTTELLLDRAGHERWGRLVFQVEPSDATISSSPEGEPQARGTLVRPGLYEVKARREGFSETSAFGEIRAGEDKTITLKLQKIEDQSLVHSAWFWGVVGAGALAVGVTVLAIQQFGDQRECVCVTFTDASCAVCTH